MKQKERLLERDWSRAWEKLPQAPSLERRLPLLWSHALRPLRRLRLFFQRGLGRWRHGYGEADTSSFHHYLAGVIAGGVGRLRARQLAHPARLSAEAWDETLDVIVLGFQAAEKGPWEMNEADWDAYHKAMALFSDFFFDLWD